MRAARFRLVFGRSVRGSKEGTVCPALASRPCVARSFVNHRRAAM